MKSTCGKDVPNQRSYFQVSLSLPVLVNLSYFFSKTQLKTHWPISYSSSVGILSCCYYTSTHALSGI